MRALRKTWVGNVPGVGRNEVPDLWTTGGERALPELNQCPNDNSCRRTASITTLTAAATTITEIGKKSFFYDQKRPLTLPNEPGKLLFSGLYVYVRSLHCFTLLVG